MKKTALALLSAIALCVAQQATATVILGPGSSAVLTAADMAAVPAGPALATVVSPFADNNGLFTGVLTTSVYTGDPANVFGPNALTFVYNLANNAASTPLGRLTLNGWNLSPLAGVNNSAGVPADLANRIVIDTLGFTWLSGLQGGQSSTVIAYSPLTQFGAEDASIIDGGIAAAATLAPVPEPATVMAGFGALALLFLSLRQRR